MSRLTRRRLLAGGGAALGAGAVGLATVAHPRQLWHRLSGACGSEPPRLSLHLHDSVAQAVTKSRNATVRAGPVALVSVDGGHPAPEHRVVAALSDLAGRHRPQPAAQLGDRTGAAVPASSVAFVGEGLA